MKRAAPLSILFAVILFAVAVIAEAQQPKRIPRVGYLSSGTTTSEATRSDSIRLGLRELGYTEAQNIAICVLYRKRPTSCRIVR